MLQRLIKLVRLRLKVKRLEKQLAQLETETHDLNVVLGYFSKKIKKLNKESMKCDNSIGEIDGI